MPATAMPQSPAASELTPPPAASPGTAGAADGAADGAATAPAPGWADFFMHPTRLFARGIPPEWGVALALTALYGLADGALQLAMQRGLVRALPQLKGELPAAAGQLQTNLNQLTRAITDSTPAELVAGLALNIPVSLSIYLLLASVVFVIGWRIGGAGDWQLFTRWYALLVVPGLFELAGKAVMAAALLAGLPLSGMLVVTVPVLAVSSIGWLWKIWLRFALLAGNMQVRNGRALALAFAIEAPQLILVAIMVLALLLIGVLTLAAPAGMPL